MPVSNKNQIIIEPRGGLANRMRVIATGILLSKQLHMELKCIWDENWELNCPFNDIFEPIEGIQFLEKKKVYYLFRSEVDKKSLARNMIKFLNYFIAKEYNIIGNHEVRKIHDGIIDVNTYRTNNKINYFRTCEELSDDMSELKCFVPKPELKLEISKHCRNFNKKTIGVHIRRTDHNISIQKSPTELFIKRIAKDINNDPQINFFLATDDIKTESILKSEFGDKIYSIKKEYSRDNSQGIKDAVVDFYCLANSSKIYGSYWSSFSYIASRIYNKNLKT
jgi:hypothetical protein